MLRLNLTEFWCVSGYGQWQTTYRTDEPEDEEFEYSESPRTNAVQQASRRRGRANLMKLQEEALAEQAVSHKAETDEAYEKDELEKELVDLPALTKEQVNWHRERAGLPPEPEDDDDIAISWEPGAELNELQITRGAKLFDLIDLDQDGQVDPKEIEEYFGGVRTYY